MSIGQLKVEAFQECAKGINKTKAKNAANVKRNLIELPAKALFSFRHPNNIKLSSSTLPEYNPYRLTTRAALGIMINNAVEFCTKPFKILGAKICK